MDRNKKRERIEGRADSKRKREKQEMNRSPTPNQAIRISMVAALEFCKKELKIHRENQNNRMIAYKLEEIADLEKKLK